MEEGKEDSRGGNVAAGEDGDGDEKSGRGWWRQLGVGSRDQQRDAAD